MPFIGKDWRSPGEAWVKTEDGSWEKVKILPSIPHLDMDSSSSPPASGQSPPPALTQRSIAVTIKSTREVAGYNTISEAFYRLDFVSAISDIRRFHYVTKLLHLLINQNLTSLSGCATKVLFSLLQQLTSHVSRSRQHVHILRNLLQDVKRMISSYYCWGRPLGSTVLWDQHLQTLDKICAEAAAITIPGPEEELEELTSDGQEDDEGKENLDTDDQTSDSEDDTRMGKTSGKTKGKNQRKELPEELVREILLRLSDYEDVVNSSLAFRTPHLLDESHIWRELCRYHFTRQQVRQAVSKCMTRTPAPDNDSTDGPARVDFEQVFHMLRRRFGLKEEFADTLVLCRYCRSLFWRTTGHACGQTDAPSPPAPASPSSGIPSHGQPVVLSNLQQQLNQQIQQHVNPQAQHPGIHHLNNNNEQGPRVQSSVSVPLHIPIPPQAFLKFFSL